MVLPPDVLHKLEQVLDGALPSYSVQYAKLFPRPRRTPSPDQVKNTLRCSTSAAPPGQTRDYRGVRHQIWCCNHDGHTNHWLIVRSVDMNQSQSCRFLTHDHTDPLQTTVSLVATGGSGREGCAQ
jgi:hypothetical protein